MSLSGLLRRLAEMFRPSPPAAAPEPRDERFLLTELEDRFVPAMLGQALFPIASTPATVVPQVMAASAASYQAPFVLDANNALWAARGDGSGMVNTGGYGVALRVGADAAGLPMAVIRDANSRVYVFDQGTWTDTGGYARDLVAAVNGEVFARDGNNLVYRYQLGAGWEVAHSPGTNSGLDYYATQMALGQKSFTNPVTGAATTENVLFIRDAGNHLLEYQDAGAFAPGAGAPRATWTNTGGFAFDLAVGTQGEAFIRDGNSEVYVYDGTWKATGGYASSLSVGQNDGRDYLAIQDLRGRVYVYQPDTNQWTDTGRTAAQVVAGGGEVYMRAADQRVLDYSLADHTWQDTGAFATQLCDTGFDTTPNQPGSAHLDHLAILDGNGRLYVYNGSWTATSLHANTIGTGIMPLTAPTAPPTTPVLATDPWQAAERQTLALTNQQRQQAGLAPLQLNSLLAEAASAHSANMARQNVMAHVLDGLSPADRITDVGYSWSAIGENIAYGQTSAAEVMADWMNSPEHRANILNPQYTEIGIGIAADAQGVLYFTQDFGRPSGR